MKSLRLRFTLWFGLCLFAVIGVFMVVTHYHLEYELRSETREPRLPGNDGWKLHGAYSEAEVHDIVGELWQSALVYAAPTLILSLGVGFLLARRAFEPVADMRRQLHAITGHNLAERIHLADADQEFRAIETAINALLTRLETTFTQLTEYSAQVAHELRTPLTLLRLKVEDAADKIEPELSESLQEELARLSEYVDQCLLLATAEQGRLTSTSEIVELRAFLSDILDNFVLLARSEGREVVLHADQPVSIQVDPRRLRQILHNLLTNAIQHGAGTITVSLATLGDGVLCRVENQRGAATRPHQGHRGLGLRIVRAIASSQGIGFNAGEQSDGRHRAELTFPAKLKFDPGALPSSKIAEPWHEGEHVADGSVGGSG